jgi:nucleoside 2-deoxyribosyltransferase
MIVAPVLAYVVGLYRDPRGPYYIRENIREAEAVAAYLWQHGIPTLCPHLNTALMDGLAPDEVFLKGDLVMLARCDVLVTVPNWRRSQGTQQEILFAVDRRIPVYDSDSDAFEAWVQANAARTPGGTR